MGVQGDRSRRHLSPLLVTMAIHKLSPQGIQKIQQYLESILVIPDLENHPRHYSLVEVDEEFPEPTSLDALGDLFRAASSPEDVISAPNLEGRWFLSSSNPGAVFAKLPGLQLKPNLRLVTYLLRTEGRGKGQTWAVPEQWGATAELEEALLDSDYNHPPYPEGALPHVMAGVEGDGTPTSYMVASLLDRVLMEFGAIGQDSQWSHHRLIASIPTKVQWQWKTEIPQDLSPKVRVFEDGRAAVEFFTCRVTPPIAISRHLDQFGSHTYYSKQLDRIIATQGH
jgi:hypothetical protein